MWYLTDMGVVGLGAKAILSSERGFTLLETLIAMGILALVLLSLTLAASGGILATGKVTQRGTVWDIARGQMENVKDQSYITSPTVYPTLTPPDPYTVTVVATPLGSSDQGIQLVTVTVYLQGNPMATLEDYKANR